MKTTTFARRREGARAGGLAFAGLLLASLLSAGFLAAPAQAQALAAPLPAEPPTPPSAAATKQLHALFDARWEATMRRYPEYATELGDHRYGDRLFDASPAARRVDFAAARVALARAQGVDRHALAAVDQVSLDLFVHELREQLRFEPFVGYRSLSLGALGGFQTEFADLLSSSPVATTAQVEQILARMAAYPQRVDEEIAALRAGLQLGWVAPRSVLARVLVQLDAQLAPAADAGPFFVPFTTLGSAIAANQQHDLRERARHAIDAQVLPALRRLRGFVNDVYLPGAALDGALHRYPDGERVYAALVQSHTTTELSPTQIHALGLGELTRLRAAMAAVQREVGFGGDFAQFVQHLNTDPKFFHSSAPALLAGYREIAKRIDPELPKLFAELARAPYGVRAMPAHMSAQRAEYYDPPALDGTRPGWFNANTQAWRTRPVWGMETLVAHETVPGHHLQMARALELGDLPKFRRAGRYTAFIEGWALYAETLGGELGLYRDPYSHFGHLQAQAFRAARLVVDTGIHALGWNRQQAIDWMVERTGREPAFVSSEVDRYYSMPAQALSYMVGQLKIVELRERARAQLGARFDIRRFHSVVLDQGAVPLPLLERAVDAWIAAMPAPP